MQMVPARTSLTSFSRETIWPLRLLRLLVTIGDADHCTKAWMDFMIVRSISPYNGIIGRPGIREIQAVHSTAHGMLKFPADGGIVTIRSTILIPAECATVITSPKEIPKEAGTSHQNLKVAIHPNFPDQEVAIGGTLSLAGHTELCKLLKKNLDIFAWQPSDMTGVPRSIAEHRLNIREGYSPVRQKKRGQAPERAKAIQAEVQKLVAAGIMREVYYHDWLSNPVMVKKHDGSWRMCVDFTDLNKACPQDCYPLPEIDWKIESLCGYPFKCFLDAYKGYHQIQMAESDEEKTAFHTSQGVYCYTKMPFGLKNAGATYQRLVDRAFDSQVGRNMEVYVDDLVIKSHTEAEMLRDVGETFRTLRKINMKLNPKKCTFGAVEGMFLGYMCGVNLLLGTCLNYTYSDGKSVTCCGCEDPLRGGFCSFCASKDGNSFDYNLNPNSFNESQNFFDYPPQPRYETNFCELCGNDTHFGYDCPTQVPFNSNPDPCYNQNFDNNFPLTSPSFPQQYRCCENCGGPHAAFQCQPMNQDFYNSNLSDFDQFQPSQFPVNYPPQETNKEILQAREDLMETIQAFLKENDHVPPNKKYMALLLAGERFLKIKQTMEEE
ncbi:reverse transcriptase domain-containing protein [Tanacetum coccineum]